MVSRNYQQGLIVGESFSFMYLLIWSSKFIKLDVCGRPLLQIHTYVRCKVLFLDLSLSLFSLLCQASCSAIPNVKIPYLILLLYCIYQLALMTLPSTRPAHFIYLWLIYSFQFLPWIHSGNSTNALSTYNSNFNSGKLL